MTPFPSDLGPIDDAASFRGAVITVLPRLLLSTTSAAPESADRSPAAAAGNAGPCEAAYGAAHPDLGAVALRGVAHRDGTTLPVIAFRVPAPPPGPPQTPAIRAFLVEPDTCRVIFDETF